MKTAIHEINFVSEILGFTATRTVAGGETPMFKWLRGKANEEWEVA